MLGERMLPYRLFQQYDIDMDFDMNAMQDLTKCLQARARPYKQWAARNGP
jgi:hypothetical protein